VEEDKSLKDIIAMGHPEALVRRVMSGVQKAEYKRRQGPAGVRISRCNFGDDRRYPITSGFKRD
jgi:NAD+ synthase (glutamine-hydrolysing)